MRNSQILKFSNSQIQKSGFEVYFFNPSFVQIDAFTCTHARNSMGLSNQLEMIDIIIRKIIEKL